MTRSENMEHVEVLRQAIAELRQDNIPALRRATAVQKAESAIAALSAQSPAEAQPDWEVAPPGATHYQPHQDAYYKRVSASEWYVWSRVDDRELMRWLPSLGTGDSAEWVVRPTDAMPPPSAPVGAEAIREAFDEISGLCRHLRQGGPAPEDLQDLSAALDEAVGIAANMLHALAQQYRQRPPRTRPAPRALPPASATRAILPTGSDPPLGHEVAGQVGQVGAGDGRVQIDDLADSAVM